VVALAVLSTGPAVAGPYTDELAKCLVKSTSDADKTYLVKWIFASMTLHPDVRAVANVSDAQREDLNRNAGKLVERLLTEGCPSETQDAVKNEGPGTLQAGFQVLGEVATRRLFSDPSVVKGMADFGRHIDKQKIEKLLGPMP
jgi:hypothetical protein